MQRLEVRDFAHWRAVARPLLATGTPPAEIEWSDWRIPSLGVAGQPADTVFQSSDAGLPGVAITIPHRLLSLLEKIACYRDAARWELMYRLAWRVTKEGRGVLEDAADSDVALAREWQQAVDRDVHKMEAFVRFHETHTVDGGKLYVAWFEPCHEILRRAAPFFANRFPNMQWMIATPDGAAVWTGARVELIASPPRSALPRADSTHPLWRVYYQSVCNVARINPETMQRHMPRRYWRQLPEAAEIPALITNGRVLAQRSLEQPPAGDEMRMSRGIKCALPPVIDPDASPMTCRRCDLWRHATQAVTGEGPSRAAIMLVGEQPGDEEDLRGRPFVGPAGRLLDELLSECGLDRAQLFVTNSVKHFKWEPRGKRRLHKRPDAREVHACGTWLAREIAAVRPKVIVAMGATAIRAVSGSTVKVEEARQRLYRHAGGALMLATYHPSAILRAKGEYQALMRETVKLDLKRAASAVDGTG